MKTQPNSGTRRSSRTVSRVTLTTIALWLSVASPHAQTLREASANFPGLQVGAAIKASSLGGANYSNALRHHFNLPSPENDTKWGVLRPTQSQFAFAAADHNVAFARAAGQQIRGHTLQWYKSIPGWLTNGGFSTTEARDILFNHIDTVGEHFRGAVSAWDVVNEAFNDNGSLRDGFWYNAPGIGYATDGTRYIEETFIRAAAADPDALLLYNDYGAETGNAKSNAIYAMAQDFLNRGVPIHGIGFQMHIEDINYASLRANFKRFNDLGLDLHITEMDVRIPVDANGDATPAALDSQAEIYWNVMGVVLGQPRFKVLQTWGLTDNDSWIPGFFPGYGAALLLGEDYQRKPGYWAVWNALANQAEKLSVLDFSAGDSTSLFTSQETLSAGAARQLDANAAGDFMTLALPIHFPGQWNVKIGYRTSGASGQFQLAAAPAGSGSFTNIGGVVDAYSGPVGTNATNLGNFNFTSAGNWQVRLTVAGKNTSASDHNLTIDYIRITPVSDGSNTPPTVSAVSDKTINANASSGPHSFTIGDGQTPANALTVEAVSLNTTLLPTANIVLAGTAANRSVTVTPAANQFGSAAVLLLVSDGVNTTPETFILNVAEVVTSFNWTRTTTGTQTWSTASNWQPATVPANSSETQLRFMDGITLGSGTVTANNNLAGTFAHHTLTLGGTGGASTTSGVTLSGNALSLATRPITSALPVVDLAANKSTAANSSLLYTITSAISLSNDATFTGSGTADFVIAGPIGSSGSLTKSGSSTLKLTGTNTYAGTTSVTGGILQIGNDTASGTLGTGAVTNDSILAFHRSDTALDVANPISGPGSLQFGTTTGGTNTAVTTLSGPNSFTGDVRIFNGGLRITASDGLGTGPKTIRLTDSARRTRLILDGGAGGIHLPANLSFITSNDNATFSAIMNHAGNNSIAGDFVLTSGGGPTAVNVTGGTLALSGTFKPDTITRSLDLVGTGNGTFSGALQDNAAFIPALRKSGLGTWTITGAANNFSGATTVMAGTLLVQSPGTLPAGSAVTVESGGTLGGNGSIHGSVNLLSGGILAPAGIGVAGTLTLANASAAALTLNGNTLPFDIPATGSSDQILIAGNLVLNGTNALSLTAGLPPPGIYTLITYAAKTGTGTLNLSETYPNAALTVGPAGVTLAVFSSEVTWTGNVDGTWDTGTTNWSRDGGPSTYANGDRVIFDDTASGNFTVSGDASPLSVTVNNSTHPYTLNGIIGGLDTTLAKSGGGTLTLTGANTYGGANTLSGGILDVGPLAAGSLGSGGLHPSNGAVLQCSGVFTRAFSGIAVAGDNQITGTSGGFAARSGPLTLNFGGLAPPAPIALNNGTFRFGTNFVLGSSAADSPVTLVNPMGLGGFNRTITVIPGTGGDFARISGVVSDSWGIVKQGGGLLALSGNNLHTGHTTINAGTLRAEHDNALGIGTATLALNGTDTLLELAESITLDRSLTITNNGDNKTLRLQPGATAGNHAGTIQIDETGASNFDLSTEAGQTLTLSGKISGTAAAGLDKHGAGTVILAATDNAYTSPTRIFGGVLIVANLSDATAAAGDTSSPSSLGSTTDASGNLVINGGTLRHEAANTTSTNRKFATGLAGATIDSSAASPAHTFSFTSQFAMGLNGQSGPRTLTLAGTNTGANLMHVDIDDDATGTPTSLVKNGPGTWHLTGANHFTGDTTVNGGTLHLGETGQLRFRIGDTSGTSNRISGEGTVTLDGTFVIDTTLPEAAALTTGSWILENVTTLAGPYGATFRVIGFDDAGNNRWRKIDDTRTWTFDETAGELVLSITPSADPYTAWIESPAFNSPALSAEDKLPGSDPDFDGTPNFLEFALNGNPADPRDRGLTASLIQDASSPAGNELTLIIAVRAGATFSAGGATVDGVTYRVEGSLDLAFPTSVVSSTGPSNSAPATTGLPSLGSSDWEYHTFKLDASEGLPGKGFLRLKVTRP